MISMTQQDCYSRTWTSCSPFLMRQDMCSCQRLSWMRRLADSRMCCLEYLRDDNWNHTQSFFVAPLRRIGKGSLSAVGRITFEASQSQTERALAQNGGFRWGSNLRVWGIQADAEHIAKVIEISPEHTAESAAIGWSEQHGSQVLIWTALGYGCRTRWTRNRRPVLIACMALHLEIDWAYTVRGRGPFTWRDATVSRSLAVETSVTRGSAVPLERESSSCRPPATCRCWAAAAVWSGPRAAESGFVRSREAQRSGKTGAAIPRRYDEAAGLQVGGSFRSTLVTRAREAQEETSRGT